MTSEQFSEESTQMLDGSSTTSTLPSDDKKDKDDARRILKRGDLARIVSRKPGKLKDHNGDLGRILRSIPMNDDGGDDNENNDSNDQTSCRPQHHPFLYDVELILGGRLTNVERCDLQYTTAFNEGMTGDARQQRKRKQSQILEESNAAASSRGKKKPVTKKTNGGMGAVTATTTTTDAKKRNTTGTGTVTGKSSKKLKQSSQSADVNYTSIIISTATNTNGTDPFERHRRELERCMVRLEKVDAYCFFCGEVPLEFQENYHKASMIATIDCTINDGIATTTVGNQQSEQSPINEASTTSQPNNSTSKDDDTFIFPDHPPFNLTVLRQRMEHGRYILDREQFEIDERVNLMTPYWKSIRRKIPTVNSQTQKRLQNFPVRYTQAINWELFRNDVIGMCDVAVERNPDSGESAGTIGNAATKIRDLMEQMFEKTGKKQDQELELLNDRHRFTIAMEAHLNMEAAMQGKWKKDAFAEREYERLRTDAVCAGLSELDERIATYELKTSLEDKFIGLSYTYDDTGQSEGWMKSMLDEADNDKNAEESAALALSSDDGVIKAQVAASMQTLLIAVQDRVMTDLGVLKQPELRSANWECGPDKVVQSTNSATAEIVEQPVWGIDCYTRRNISTCLETEFDSDTVLTFVEKWLLPAVNACPADLAYNLVNAARILEGLPFDSSSSLLQEKGTKPEQWSETLLGKALVRKIHESAPPWLRSAAHLLRKSITSLGLDFFRVHPKGHGSIVLCPKIPPNRLVTFYRGEVYPSWRWGEKMDAISLIQKRKGLKPRLPDFFNMALERPQSDPRGYGILYVDASRKSGYGSMLSHSCKPSCEVRVAAINGELVLAMTTLREMTIGDEVTFDYNAVTESLHEYQAAVCLCGHGQCRGSFLHFATADCYQQVLNRNSPVAVRLAQLIKGSAKKVMAEDDDRILKRHGFQTAAFGAVSVNRRIAIDSDVTTAALDSMECVPIWLRTFVADILRYIEYERRALPIALICNQISNALDEANGGDSNAGKEQIGGTKEEQTKKKKQIIPSDEPEWIPPPEKAIKGSKPEPTFFFFVRIRREYFLSMLIDEDAESTMRGTELEREVKKMASAEWNTFSPEVKQHWKQQAFAEWERNGGKEKARLEELRLKKAADASVRSSSNERAKSCDTDPELTKMTEAESTGHKGDGSNKISFQAADAEGISAMEQRIQQLTQALSRVGRVLDRHREERMREHETSSSSHKKSLDSSADLRELAHSPLSIMPDEDVVAWIWNHSEGVVRTLLEMVDDEICVSPSMKIALKQTESKYSALAEFGTPWIAGYSASKFSLSPTKGRTLLNDALLDFRTILLDGIEVMAADIKKQRKQSSSAREAAKKKEEQTKEIDKISSDSSEHAIRYAVKYVLNDMLDIVEGSAKNPTTQEGERSSQGDNDEILDPWLQNFNKRFKIEKAADLLLLYARTSTFFRLKPYEPLQSTPIEVYARELGNSVPRSVMDETRVLATEKSGNERLHEDPQLSQSIIGSAENQDDNVSVSSNYLSVSSNQMGGDDPLQASKKSKVCGLCEPEDIVSEVVVDYQGDYVLSQLLQWYNAGIEQKAGLPDLLGCALLPSMSGCWTIDYTKVSNASTGKWTGYRQNIRPRLVDWLQDPYKRGNPWSDELRRGFVEKSQEKLVDDTSNLWLPIGSPVLDFLVTGDDFNIMDILHELGSYSGATESEASGGLLSSIDHGRPAQAVSNWVQCENPDCLKWRKIPWHVDVDMLSMKFVCSDNVWNEKSASCDAPEDEWDETADACVEADGSVKPIEIVKDIQPLECDNVSPASETSCTLAEFRVGARFDVLRPVKNVWSTATVVDVDFVGMTKRIKFHYPRTQIKHDEWLEVGSSRIASLYTHTSQPQQKATDAESLQSKGGTSKKNDSEIPQIRIPPSLETSSKHLPTSKESKATRLKRLKQLKKASANTSSIEPSSSKVDPQGSQLDVASEDEEGPCNVDDSATAPLGDTLPLAFEEGEDEDSERESPSFDTYAKSLPTAKESKATRLKRLKQLKKANENKTSRVPSSSKGCFQRGQLYDTSDEEEWAGDGVEGSANAASSDPSFDEGKDEESEQESIDPRTPAVALTQDEYNGNGVSDKMVESVVPSVTDHSSPDGSPKREGDNIMVHSSPVEIQGPALTDSSSPSFKIPKKRQQSSESMSLIARKHKVVGHVSLISKVEKPIDVRKPTKTPTGSEKPNKLLVSQYKDRAARQNDQRSTQQHARSPPERNLLSPALACEMAPGPRTPVIRNNLDFTNERRGASHPSRPELRNTPEQNHSRREPLRDDMTFKSSKPRELHLSDASGRNKYSWVGDSPVADANNDSRDRWSEAPMHPSPRLSHSPRQRRDRRMDSDRQEYVDYGMDRAGQGFDTWRGNIDSDHHSRNHDTHFDERKYERKSEFNMIDSPRRSYPGGPEVDRGVPRVPEEFVNPGARPRDVDSWKGFSSRDGGWRYDVQYEDGEKAERSTYSHRPREGERDDHWISSGYSHRYGDYRNHESWDHHRQNGDSIGRTSEREYDYNDMKAREDRWRNDEHDAYGRSDVGYEEGYRERESDYNRDFPPRYNESSSPRDDDRRRHRDSKRRKEGKSRRCYDGKDEYSRRMKDYRDQTVRGVGPARRYDDRGDAVSIDMHTRHWDDHHNSSPRKSLRDY